METHIAQRKPHRCDACGRKIPIGARYFSQSRGEFREHTNCEDYAKEPMLAWNYNQCRAAGEVKWGDSYPD